MYAQWNSTAVTGVSANPASLPFSGGSSTITVGGVSLTLETLTVTAFDVASSTSISATRTGAGTVSLAFPANNTGAAKAYTIKVSLDGGTTWEAATATVTVAAYVPSGGSDGDSYAPPSSLRIVNNIITITQLDGTRTKMGVQATGGYPPYTYQWQRKGSWIDIPGATSAEFTWEGLTPGQTYTVRCVVKDRLGTTVISPELTFIAGEGLSAFSATGEITSKNVNVRSNANTKGKRLGRLQTGDEVSILGYTAPKGYPTGFFKIAWDNEAGFAYISADYVSVTFTSPLSAGILGRVYMQSRMNTAKKYRVATLGNGNTAKLLGRYKTWWLVELNGETTYLKNGKYVQP